MNDKLEAQAVLSGNSRQTASNPSGTSASRFREKTQVDRERRDRIRNDALEWWAVRNVVHIRGAPLRYRLRSANDASSYVGNRAGAQCAPGKK